MKKIEQLREKIYDHFHGSTSCANYFFDGSHSDEYATYYTTMYLLQDSIEGLSEHRNKGFNTNELLAYIEIWGVLQAVIIQQDSIKTLYEVLTQNKISIPQNSNWKEIRTFRNLCGGHPVDKGRPGKRERAFMGRGFGTYDNLLIEVWNEAKGKTEFREIDLGKLIDEYAAEAVKYLQDIITILPTKWP